MRLSVKFLEIKIPSKKIGSDPGKEERRMIWEGGVFWVLLKKLVLFSTFTEQNRTKVRRHS